MPLIRCPRCEEERPEPGLRQAGAAHPVRALLAIFAMLALCGAAQADFPSQEISRAEAVHEWPFSVDRGTLTCVEFGGQRVIIFAEPWRTDVPQVFGNMTPPRSVIVATNPFALLASLEDRALYLPFDSLETLILRLAPYEEQGRALCRAQKAAPDDEP